MAKKGITIDEAIDDVVRKRNKAMEEILTIVEADAKAMCPVDTGTLRRSITHQKEETKTGSRGSVGSNILYAFWAEQHKPYLEPAVDMNKENIIRKIAEVMKSE